MYQMAIKSLLILNSVNFAKSGMFEQLVAFFRYLNPRPTAKYI